MNTRNRDRNFKNGTNKKLISSLLGFMLLPIVAACGTTNNTAQTPPTTAPTEQPTTNVPTTPAPAPGNGATATENVVDVVNADPSLTTLSNLLDEADLQDRLKDGGPHTIFAPSDQAFAALPEATRQRLLLPENREVLRQILTYHVVSGSLSAEQIQPGNIENLAGETVNVSVDRGNNEVRVNDARVTQPNIQASNGVIHVVDRVILPPNLQVEIDRNGESSVAQNK